MELKQTTLHCEGPLQYKTLRAIGFPEPQEEDYAFLRGQKFPTDFIPFWNPKKKTMCPFKRHDLLSTRPQQGPHPSLQVRDRNRISPPIIVWRSSTNNLDILLYHKNKLPHNLSRSHTILASLAFWPEQLVFYLITTFFATFPTNNCCTLARQSLCPSMSLGQYKWTAHDFVVRRGRWRMGLPYTDAILPWASNNQAIEVA